MHVMLFTAIFYISLETALLARNWGLTPHLKFNLNSRNMHVLEVVVFCQTVFQLWDPELHPREAGNGMAEEADSQSRQSSVRLWYWSFGDLSGFPGAYRQAEAVTVCVCVTVGLG